MRTNGAVLGCYTGLRCSEFSHIRNIIRKQGLKKLDRFSNTEVIGDNFGLELYLLHITMSNKNFQYQAMIAPRSVFFIKLRNVRSVF